MWHFKKQKLVQKSTMSMLPKFSIKPQALKWPNHCYWFWLYWRFWYSIHQGFLLLLHVLIFQNNYCIHVLVILILEFFGSLLNVLLGASASLTSPCSWLWSPWQLAQDFVQICPQLIFHEWMNEYQQTYFRCFFFSFLLSKSKMTLKPPSSIYYDI